MIVEGDSWRGPGGRSLKTLEHCMKDTPLSFQGRAMHLANAPIDALPVRQSPEGGISFIANCCCIARVHQDHQFWSYSSSVGVDFDAQLLVPKSMYIYIRLCRCLCMCMHMSYAIFLSQAQQILYILPLGPI